MFVCLYVFGGYLTTSGTQRVQNSRVAESESESESPGVVVIIEESESECDAPVTNPVRMGPCLCNVLFIGLQQGTTFAPLSTLSREISLKNMQTYIHIHTYIHKSPEPVFHRSLESGFTPPALSLRLKSAKDLLLSKEYNLNLNPPLLTSAPVVVWGGVSF